MAYTFCDMQMLRGAKDEYVVKEFSLYSSQFDGSRGTTIFKPPYADTILSPEQRKRNTYITRHIHGLKWNSGTVPYEHLGDMIQELLRDYNRIYVKGVEKLRLLLGYAPPGVLVYNIERDGCPRLKTLPKLFVSFHGSEHSVFPIHNCAELNAKRIGLCVPYYELRRKVLEAASPHTTDLLVDYEEVVRAVRATRPGLVVRGVNLAALKDKLQVPQSQYHSKYSSMVQSVIVHKKQVLAVLEAIDQQPLADRLKLRHQDPEATTAATDFIALLSRLEKTGNVAAGDLTTLLKHLQTKITDPPEVSLMKSGVSDILLLMEVLVVIKEAKEMVTYLKASGLASTLSKKVLQEVETRWNSLHTMLVSVLEMYDEIFTVLSNQARGQLPRLRKIDRGILQWLTVFLSEFKEETKRLEGNSTGHPTMPYILLVSTGLRDHSQPALDDCQHLAIIKERCLQFLHSKFVPSMKAKIATFLWPDYKELTMLSRQEKDEVIAKVRSIISERDADGEPGADAEDVDAPPPPKAPRQDDKYRKYRQAQSNPDVPQDEVTQYLEMGATTPAEELLQFWKLLDRPGGLPKLSQLTRRELGKLATAAPSERVWSKTGFILNNRRNRLSPSHLNSIIFLGSFLKNMKK
ncbi:Transposable element Hobo transposase [Frankliniella fusca]|uniref:Transposable element Hobo transposase n=1 Tax=Frankliniella fusca TaxID=407009 RepID=A0AAE1H0L0_9NEOP|nr:Transposable element Hobo transposase [Frankliniella fusca]